MIWARYRFQKVAGPQRWRWEHFPDTMDKKSIDSHYQEMCSEEAAMYERGARIEWEIGEVPPRAVLEAEAKWLKTKAKTLREQAAKIDAALKRGRGFMTEARLEKLNEGARG